MRTVNLDEITLLRGSHEPGSKYCVMELAAYIAEEPWSDAPKSVSPVIGAFLSSWNDLLLDEPRQMLKPYAIKSLNTAGTRAQEEQRAWMATDWLARECAPAFLRLAGLTEHAESLKNLTPLTGEREAKAAQRKVDAAVRDAGAASAACAARTANAVWDINAALDVSAAWAASGARAACTVSAAWAVSGARAAAAARDASASSAACAGASAALDALETTVKILQASALLLLDRMIAVK